MAELTLKTKGSADRDVLAKREKRAMSAEIAIPDCVNPSRRERCLQDPELFLKTYFADKYRLPFGKHHHFMIESIVMLIPMHLPMILCGEQYRRERNPPH